MTATINQALAELKTRLETDLVPGSAKIVRDYRTLSDKLSPEIILSYQGRRPGQGTTAGDFSAFDIIAVLVVRVDTTAADYEAALRAAEQTLNTLEDGLISTLSKGGGGYKTTYWRRVSFPSPTTRPPSPVESVNIRWANVPFRLILS